MESLVLDIDTFVFAFPFHIFLGLYPFFVRFIRLLVHRYDVIESREQLTSTIGNLTYRPVISGPYNYFHLRLYTATDTLNYVPLYSCDIVILITFTWVSITRSTQLIISRHRLRYEAPFNSAYQIDN